MTSDKYVSTIVRPQIHDVSNLTFEELLDRINYPLPGDNKIFLRRILSQRLLRIHENEYEAFMNEEQQTSKYNNDLNSQTLQYLKNCMKEGKLKDGFIPFSPHNIFVEILFVCLMKKYNNDCFIEQKHADTLSKRDVIERDFFVHNKTAHNEYIWTNELLQRIGNSMKLCKDRGNNVMVIPLKVVIDSQLHANLLIYRIGSNTVERFEPHGKSSDLEIGHENYFNTDEFIKNVIEEKLTPYIGKLHYISADETCPRPLGFQHLEGTFNLIDPDKRGYCQMWSLFVMELVLMNPTKSTLQIQEIVFKLTKENPFLFSLIIVGFTSIGYKMVNKVLVENGSTIINPDKILHIRETKMLNEWILNNAK